MDEVKAPAEKCERCSKVYAEALGSFRVAIERMKDLAAKGKGQQVESETNPVYNRYFGCAIAMDTVLKEYFKEELEKEFGPQDAEKAEDITEEVPADVTRN